MGVPNFLLVFRRTGRNGVGLDYDGYGRNVRVTTGANQDKWWHSGAGADRVLVEKGGNGPVKISFYAGALLTECDVQYTNGAFKDLLQGGCTHRYYLAGMRVDQTRDIRDSKWDTTRKFPFGEDSLTSGAYTEDDHFASYRGAGSGAAVDYARNRSYAPTLGTFTSADPYEASGNSMNPSLTWNRMQYADLDPIGNSDPSGLSPSHGSDPCAAGCLFQAPDAITGSGGGVIHINSVSATNHGADAAARHHVRVAVAFAADRLIRNKLLVPTLTSLGDSTMSGSGVVHNGLAYDWAVSSVLLTPEEHAKLEQIKIDFIYQLTGVMTSPGQLSTADFLRLFQTESSSGQSSATANPGTHPFVQLGVGVGVLNLSATVGQRLCIGGGPGLGVSPIPGNLTVSLVGGYAPEPQPGWQGFNIEYSIGAFAGGQFSGPLHGSGATLSWGFMSPQAGVALVGGWCF